MIQALFIDANVPIYVAGRPHPLKEPCGRILLLAEQHPDAFVTDAEVLQELLHRYLAIRLVPQGQTVLNGFAALMEGRVEPIHAADVVAAGVLAQSQGGLSARDLVHAAVMHRLGVERIVTVDTGFDRLPGIQHLDPAHFDAWWPVVGVQ